VSQIQIQPQNRLRLIVQKLMLDDFRKPSPAFVEMARANEAIRERMNEVFRPLTDGLRQLSEPFKGMANPAREAR
jgi:hypothetical protein